MPRTLSITEQFEYDRSSLRYRNLRTGRYVARRAVKLSIQRVIRNTQVEMRAVTQDMIAGRITLQEWQGRFASELKNLHVSATMAARGGPANMASADYLRAARELKFQYGKLNGFAQDIAAGRLAANQIIARADLYVASQNRTFEGSRRDGAVAAGYDEERNVLGPSEHHCTTRTRVGCKELTARGWQRIGVIEVPGNRTCLMNCKCTLRFRKRPTPTVGTLP